MRTGERWIRLWTIAAVLAAVLVPSLAAPARTLSFPRTLHDTFRFASARPASPRLVSFDVAPTHVGFSWRGPERAKISFRTRSAAGSWSPWRRAHESHDAARGDLHFSGVVSLDEPAALQWRTTHGVRDVTVDALNTLDGDRFEVTVPATAQAAAKAPTIVTRAQWGADESLASKTGGCKRKFYPLQQMFVHHTAGSNFDTRPRATMRAILWYHTQRQGWCDIGYNFVIAPDGQIFEGRWARNYGPWEIHDSEDREGRVVSGAHVSSFNEGSVGISVMGNFAAIPLPPAARRSLTELLAWESDRHDLPPRKKHWYDNPTSSTRKWLPYIAGHRDAGSTECPGGYAYSALPDIRQDVKRVIGTGKAESIVTLTPPKTRIDIGESATLSGTLTDSSSVPLAGQTIRTFIRAAGSTWRTGPEAVSGIDGTFSLVLTPKRKIRVAAVYDGDPYLWGDTSEAAIVKVVPLVTLAITNAQDIGGVAHMTAEHGKARFAGSLSPKHSGAPITLLIDRAAEDGTWVREAELTTKTKDDSTFVKAFELPKEPLPITMIATARFERDIDHPQAFSNEVLFVVDPRG